MTLLTSAKNCGSSRRKTSTAHPSEEESREKDFRTQRKLRWIDDDASIGLGAGCAPTGKNSRCSLALKASTTTSTAAGGPRTGILQGLLDLALDSPLWKHVLVPQARQKMVDTAASNGIPWTECRDWIATKSQWADMTLDEDHIPEYYRTAAFHAYPKGNLCWEAAWEQEIASAAVGARNFPEYGKTGEVAFRESFSMCLKELGASIPSSGATILDLGCGCGMSTRWLAEKYPQASKILGMDMSPYYVEVGKRLLELEPKSLLEDDDETTTQINKEDTITTPKTEATWINTIVADSRIELSVGAAEDTKLPDNSVDVVNLQFVAHELPHGITMRIIKEAHRILKPGGQLWFCEMDFETPGYGAQRANPLLFSLIRATEPFLDDYADHEQEVRDELKRLFCQTKIGPATGRHFSIVATKGGTTTSDDDYSNGTREQQQQQQHHVLEDYRFDENGNYKVEDTHLILWDNTAE